MLIIKYLIRTQQFVDRKKKLNIGKYNKFKLFIIEKIIHNFLIT